MPALFVAANQVTGTGVFGHLQIVYDAGDSGPLVETEVTAPLNPFGSWVFNPIRDHASNTPNYGDPNEYEIQPILLAPGQDATFVWELIGQIADSISINGAELDYEGFFQNSNSYINTLCYVIGVTTDWSETLDVGDIWDFPAYHRNVLFEADVGGEDITGIELSLFGTEGNDIVNSGNGDDFLGGAGGADTISSGDGNDTLSGGTGNDILHAGEGADTLTGGGDNDTLIARGGGDTLSGGAGNDSYKLSRVVNSLFGPPVYTIREGGTGNDTVEIHDVAEGELQPISLTLNSFADLNFKASGNQLIIDIDIVGAVYNDDNEGRIQIVGQGNLTTRIETLKLFDSAGGALSTSISLVSIWNALLAFGDGAYHRFEISETTGQFGSLVESGDSFSSDGWIYGTEVSGVAPYGNDNLVGTSGNDTFVMSSGQDIITGGSGFDTLKVDRDLTGSNSGILYNIDGGYIQSGTSYSVIQTALLSASTSYFIDLGYFDETTATSIERFEVNLTGSSSSDLLIYQNGTRYHGGAGTDTFYANWASATNNVIWNNTPAATQTVTLNSNAISVSGLERLLITTGSGADTITNTNTSADDYISTGAGNDTINGGGGNDTIDGGLGLDTLSGGIGDDIFVFKSLADSTLLSSGRDKILDFDVATSDRIDLSLIDAITGGVNNQFSFIGDAAFTGVGQVRYFHSGNSTIVSVNTEAGTTAEMFIQISGVLTLSSSNFIL